MVKVVLCICTCKRPVGLARLLEAVAGLNFEGQLSVVVVDNDAAGAAEGLAVCRRMAAAGYRWPLTSVAEERRGTSFARNRVIAVALEQGPDFIAMLDDDERPCREWLREVLRVQAETDADVVGGPVLAEFQSGAPAWLIETRLFEKFCEYRDGAQVGVLSASNFMAKACCFRALMPEPFDTRFALTGGSSWPFFRGLAARKYKMYWAAHAPVIETVPPSRANLRWLMQRRFRKGMNDVRRQQMFEPGVGHELHQAVITMKILAVGAIHFIANWWRGNRRREAVLTISAALGRAAGHLRVRYSEYRRIHGV